jgi:uncharacterized protein
MKIINNHTHIVIKKDETGFMGDIPELIEDMEKAGIEKSIILAGEKGQISVKELLEKIGKDKRFAIIYTVDITKNIKTQENEIQCLFKNNEIKGVKILLGYDYIMPDDKKLEGIYKLCEKYDFPVIFHTGDTLAGVVDKPKLIYSHPLNIDSLAVEHPNLKIIIAHIGNPWTIDAAAVINKNRNVYGDLSGFFLNFDDKSYIDFVRNKINEFIAYASGDKLLFGTDFPLADGSEYVKFVKSLNIGKEVSEKIFHKNAEELFKI